MVFNSSETLTRCSPASFSSLFPTKPFFRKKRMNSLFLIFQWISLEVQIFFLSLQMFSDQSLPMSRIEEWESIYWKGVLVTLCAWRIGIWQFQLVVKNQSSNDAHGYVISDSIADCTSKHSCEYVVYISAWASALLVQLLGRCQSLDAWDEQQVLTPTLFSCISRI